MKKNVEKIVHYEEDSESEVDTLTPDPLPDPDDS
jgi:hypothetical protein